MSDGLPIAVVALGRTAAERRAQRSMEAAKGVLEDMIALQRNDATPGELARMYAVSVTAHRAANLRAEVVAQVPYRVVDAKGNPVETHPLSQLVHDSADLHDLMTRTELTLCFWGHSLLVKERMLSGRVTGLRWLNPRLYTADVDPYQGLRGFRLWGRENRENYLARANAIYLHGVDFNDDFGGVSPAEVAFDQAGIETEAALTAVWFLRNRAVPAAILQPKDAEATPPTEAEQRKVRSLIQRILKGARNAGKTLVSGGRWEWVSVQAEFDKIGMGELTEDARAAIAMAFNVPLDLIMPTSSTYAELYQSHKAWMEHFVKGRCRWYARKFNQQLAAEWTDGVRLEPDFGAVFEADEQQQTEVASTQVGAGLLDLYSAQQKAGIEQPDARLKDIYVFNGQPTHIDEIVRLARTPQTGSYGPDDPASGNISRWPGGNGDGGDGTAPSDNGSGEKLPARPPTPLPPGAGRSGPIVAAAPAGDAPVSGNISRLATGDGADPPPDDWLPDALFDELRTCARVVARKGADYAFQPDALPGDVVALVRLLVATGADEDEALTAARGYLLASRREFAGRKDYANVERRYREALFDLVRSAFSQKVDRREFGELGRTEISAAFEAAFKQGLHDTGVPVEELEPGEKAFVHEQAIAERRHWTSLANSVFKDMASIRAQMDEVRQRQASTGDPDEAEELRAELLSLKQGLIAARERVTERLTLWTQGLRRIYHQGQLSSQRNQMLRWRVTPGKEHCRTCLAADGQVHRASTWARYGLYPGAEVLECVHSAGGVPVCGCSFEVVSEPAQGRIRSIPYVRTGRDGTKSLYCPEPPGEPAERAEPPETAQEPVDMPEPPGEPADPAPSDTPKPAEDSAEAAS